MAEKTKRSGMLGGLSFKRSAKPKKAATSNATPTPEPQITGPPLPASAMAGKLVNCPLQSAEYAEAWALATKLGRRPKVSRLHGSLDGLLTDSAATQHFVNHQKANHNIAMYNFWKLVKKYADDFVKRSVEDRNVMAVDIFDRFVAKSVFDLPAAIKTQLTKVVDKKSDFKVNVFDQAQQHVYTELKTKQFNDFQKSPQYSQHCITVITSGTVYLEDMLYNESFLMGFMEYMTMENSSSIIQFWLIADDFQTQLLQVDKKGKPTLDAAHAKSDAMGIFKRFFATDAGEPLGVDEATKKETEKLVCQDAGPDRFCFRRPLHLVYTALTKHFFPSYLQSDAFMQYLNSLMSVSKTSTKQPSTPSSTNNNNNNATSPEPSTTVEEYDASKPRTLKRRDSQLGLIDNLGVYQRDGDANHPLFNDSSADKSSRMGKMASAVGMKKKNTKAEQDMAVQVARMIVNQIYREMHEHSTIDHHVTAIPPP